MSLEKGFLGHSKISILNKRAVIGFFISFGISIGLYSLLSFLRFIVILLQSNIYNNGHIHISNDDLYWQNFCFALISFVFGHSIFLLSIFTKPLKFTFSNLKRRSILNNQVFLGFNFYYLFFKVFFLILFIVASEVFFLFSDNYFLFYLFAIVLYLESWKTILLVFKKKAYKPLFINAILIILLSFIIAFTSIFNMKKLYNVLSEINPKIDLPVVNYKFLNHSNTIRWKVNVIKINTIDHQNTYILNETIHSNFQDLYTNLNNEKQLQRHFYPSNFLIFAPSKIKMTEINKIRFMVFDLQNSFNFYFVTANTLENKDELRALSKRDFFSEQKIIKFLKDNDLPADRPPPPPPPPFLSNIEISENKKIRLQIEGGDYFINENRIDKNHLEEAFEKHIIKQNSIHFIYSEEETTYQEFLTAYSAYRKAIYNLRGAAQKVELMIENFRDLNREAYEADQNRVITMYPIRYLENDFRLPDISINKN